MRDHLARLRGSLFRLTMRVARRNVTIGRGLALYHRLHVGGRGEIRIGRNCTVRGATGDRSQYACLDTVRPDACITVGDDVSLYAARVMAAFEITIGAGTIVDESAIADTDFHSIDRSRGEPPGESRARCRVEVGRGVRLGPRSYVMKGVTIGDGALVLPGSFVLSAVRPGAVVAGNPAKEVAGNR